MNPLAKFSDVALLTELQRRQETKSNLRPIVPCDECSHFVTLKDDQNPEGYNPCSKSHTLRFRLPREPYDHDEVWGFYRPRCRDRKPSDVVTEMRNGSEKTSTQ